MSYADYDDRCHAIGTAMMARFGADVTVWWDNDSSRFRCRWRGLELSPQVSRLDSQTVQDAHTRIVTAWGDEIRAELLK